MTNEHRNKKNMRRDEAKDMMNRLGSDGKPFLFLIDDTCENCIGWERDTIDPDEVLYSFEGEGNCTELPQRNATAEPLSIRPAFEDKGDYRRRFDIVMRHLKRGDSYLTNLCASIPVDVSTDLKDIFHKAKAKYKLWLKDSLVCFSPETFVTIAPDGTIASRPMKGTISANTDNALQTLLDDEKEKAEHATIVDLIRNDLSMIASDVHVTRYRYAEKLHNGAGLWQTSSLIEGKLPDDFRSHLGDILFALLPAGSVTGAPKKKTLEIISKAENFDRGFYTGVMGLWDGNRLNSAVMIRLIDKHDGSLHYKAGGGITAQSHWESEYSEICNKVYLPIH